MNNKAVLIGLSVLAFLIALLLVIAIVRLLLGGRLRMPGGRTRQARLGIVDAFDLDRQRQLIIVRRDNTEHLIMIGGPNDVLIESEIVRVEARDLRGRDKLPEPVPAVVDRIPAPFAPIERPDLPRPDLARPDLSPSDAPRAEAPRADEPLLPMSLPKTPPEMAGSPVVEPQRAPTFPLPPRRPPLPPGLPPRPIAPPRLPEGVLREDGPPPQSVPAPTRPDAPGPAADPAVKKPFLKPLPPRPPIRPLNRVTPQAPLVGPQDPAPPPPAMAPPVPPPQPAPAPKPGDSPSADVGDAFDSLEEEMAKLLGRGPSA